MKPPRPPIHGLLAEYTTAEAIVDAATRAYEAGYRRMDAFPSRWTALRRRSGSAQSHALDRGIGGLTGASLPIR